MDLHSHLSLISMLLLWCATFCSLTTSRLNSELSVVTLNIANYDDHAHWETRIMLIVRDLIAADADLISLQEVRMNPDQPSTKTTYQNQAEQILHQLNVKGYYLGAQLVVQPTMYYPFHVDKFEHTFNLALEYYNENQSLPSPWEEDVHSFLEMGDYESVREYIRKQYSDNGVVTGQYVLPKELSKESEKSMIWEGSAIISKRRILETGTIFMSTPNDCHDNNKRATQFISVSMESSDSHLSPTSGRHSKRFHLFNAHLGLETPCAISEVHEIREYMDRFKGPSLLVGDFNIEPDHIALKHLRDTGLTDLWQNFHKEQNDTLLEKASVDSTTKEIKSRPRPSPRETLLAMEFDDVLPLQDMDMSKKCPFEEWCTFPSDNPIKRIDYAWANHDLVPYAYKMHTLGTEPQQLNGMSVFPSDHLGYIIKFNFHPDHQAKRHRQDDGRQLLPVNE